MWTHKPLSWKTPVSEDTAFVEVFSVLRWSCLAINRFWHTVYSSGVWIPRATALQLVRDGFAFTVLWHANGQLPLEVQLDEA